MSRSLQKDRAAEDDLIGIWVYSFEQWGEQQADRYLDALELGIRSILENPLRGRDRGDIRHGYHSKLIGMHVVFYTFDETELRIRRVLHGAMDPDRHL